MLEVLVVILIIGAQLVRSVQKAYLSTPSRELRRRGAKGDEAARQLYHAARYETRLNFFLEIITIVLLSGCIYVVLVELAWGFYSVVFTGLILLYIFSISPTRPCGPTSLKLARFFAPY